jgi:hypothetical protein
MPAGNASAEAFRCRIGKPSYCFKYGGTLCEKWNSVPGAAKACERWTAACLDCHAAIPECLGSGQTVLSGTPRCTRCESRWLACMKKIDAKFWPNRQSPRGPGQ